MKTIKNMNKVKTQQIKQLNISQKLKETLKSSKKLILKAN